MALIFPILATPLPCLALRARSTLPPWLFSVSFLSFMQAFCTWRFDWSLPNARAAERWQPTLWCSARRSLVVRLCRHQCDLWCCMGDVLLGEARATAYDYLEILASPRAGRKRGKLMLLRLASVCPARRSECRQPATIAQSVSTFRPVDCWGTRPGGLGLVGASVLSTWAGVLTMARLIRQPARLAGWRARLRSALPSL